jgi:hypothetical protein
VEPLKHASSYLTAFNLVTENALNTGFYKARLRTLDRKLSEVLLGTIPRVSLYALPGSGKSKFARDLMTSRKMLVIDTDTFVLKDIPWDAAESDVAWKLPAFTFDDAMRYVTNMHANVTQVYLRRNCINTFAVRLEVEEWKRRVNEDERGEGRRKRLAAYKPLDDIAAEIDYTEYDAVISDFDDSAFEYIMMGPPLPVFNLSYCAEWVSSNHGTPLVPFSGQNNSDSELALLTAAQVLVLIERDPYSFARIAPHVRVYRDPYLMNHVTYIPRSVLPYWKYPTALSNVTMNTLTIWSVLSRHLGLNRTSSRAIRRRFLANRGIHVIDDPTINGIMKVDGRYVPLAISGHVMYLVIASVYSPVDFAVWADHVEWNVDKYVNRTLDIHEKFFLKSNLLHERIDSSSIFDLWHNLHEWLFGIDMALEASEFFGLPPPDADAINYLRKRLYAMGAKYPKFRSAWSQKVRERIREAPEIMRELR